MVTVDVTARHQTAGLRYQTLDSLRGICACIVVLFHFGSTGVISNLPVVRNGLLFVDFFFVLSGFVIAASYGRRLETGFPFGRYMLLRFGRIYPLHLAVLGLFIAMELAGVLFTGLTPREPFTGSRTMPDLAISVLLLQVFDLSGGLNWNAPAWSIAAEFWTYIVAGLVFVFARGLKPWIVGSVIVVSGVWLAGTPTHLLHDSDFGIVRCLFGFFIGIVAFWASNGVSAWINSLGKLAASLLEGAASGLSIGLVAMAGDSMLTMLAPPLFALAVLVFAAERGAISTLLLIRPMRLLGTLSYSIYMIHVFVQGRWLNLLEITGGRLGHSWVHTMPDGTKALMVAPLIADGLTITMLAVVIAASAFSYALVEMPAREWSRRLAARIWP